MTERKEQLNKIRIVLSTGEITIESKDTPIEKLVQIATKIAKEMRFDAHTGEWGIR